MASAPDIRSARREQDQAQTAAGDDESQSQLAGRKLPGPCIGKGEAFRLLLPLVNTLGTPADIFSTDGNGLSGQVTFNFTPTTPLPAALPLFATGIGGLGLLGRRGKRKAQAI